MPPATPTDLKTILLEEESLLTEITRLENKINEKRSSSKELREGLYQIKWGIEKYLIKHFVTLDYEPRSDKSDCSSYNFYYNTKQMEGVCVYRYYGQRDRFYFVFNVLQKTSKETFQEFMMSELAEVGLIPMSRKDRLPIQERIQRMYEKGLLLTGKEAILYLFGKYVEPDGGGLK